MMMMKFGLKTDSVGLIGFFSLNPRCDKIVAFVEIYIHWKVDLFKIYKNEWF